MNELLAARLLQGINHQTALFLEQHWPNVIFYQGEKDRFEARTDTSFWVSEQNMIKAKLDEISESELETEAKSSKQQRHRNFPGGNQEADWGHKIEI